MSEEAKISDRPYPFEVKTVLFQLFGLAISTPKDVADVCVEFGAYVDQLSIRVYVGGYDSKTNTTPQISESIYLDGRTTTMSVAAIEKLIAQINTSVADGRKIKAKRFKDEAAELLKKAAELEAHDSISV